MADLKERRERKIPVFSVWKNNVILKNIFLINAPPPLEEIKPHQQDQETENCITHQEFEETLMVGRHPDCDIRLEHPSISRLHLSIHSIPSSNNLFLIDLSSVHGTWISGKRIEPNVRTRLDEVDTLRIGGSSRIYKLHWIPLSQAYDVEQPFVPPLDFPVPQEDEEEDIEDENCSPSKNYVHLVDSNVELVVTGIVTEGLPVQQENTVAVKNEDMELVKPDFGSLFADDNPDTFVQKEIKNAFHNENSQVIKNEDSDSETLENGFKTSFEDQKFEVCIQKGIPPVPQMQDKHFEILENDRQAADSSLNGLVPLLMGENWEWIGQQNNLASPVKENYPLPFKHEDDGFISSVLDGLDDSLMEETSKLLGHGYLPSAPPMPEGMAIHLAPNLDHTLAGRARGDVLTAETILENERQSLLQRDVQDDAWNFWCGSLVETLSCPVEEVLSDAENQNLDEENQCPILESEPISERRFSKIVDFVKDDEECTDEKLWSFWSGNMGVESVCSSLSDTEAVSESESRPLRNGYQSPRPPNSGKKQFGSPLLTLEHNSTPSIWSRRGKQECVPQILTTTSTKGKKIETDQENVQDDPITRVLFHGGDDQEGEEIFTPDKENFTPNTHRSMRKMIVLKEAEHSISGKSSIQKMTRNFDIYYEDTSPVSDKKNCSPKVLQEQKTVRHASANRVKVLQPKEIKRERKPFQPLLAESPQKSISEISIPDVAVTSGKSVNCTKPTTKTRLQDTCTAERTRMWNMVVDTTTLLNKESRKALQLLAGLKGTQLFIPRIVIRELDCLKRQISFFRRNSEVMFALGWIQDCMAKTQWWIHVQGSIEEGRPVAPTPPASPQSSISYGTANSVPFSGFQSHLELISPTAEDHVLDYALSFRRTQNDGQLVLLSNDITLRIKAMAEGLICEGAEEFRESLVNPFSERFLWEDSSPRGQTWSCSDDIVLKEKFYPSSLKMTPKAMENVKGLKLILLHNSHYFERMALH